MHPIRTLTLLLVAVLSACAHRAPDTDMNARVNALADRYVDAALKRSPELAYYTGLPAPSHDYLTDNSLDALAAWRAFEDELLAEVDRVDPAALGQREWIAWGALKEMLEASRDQRICRSEVWQSVNHMFGWHLDISVFAARQPLETAADRAAALRRWATLPKYIDTDIANLRSGLERGYSAARPVAEAVLMQVEKMLEQPVQGSPLYAMISRSEDATFNADMTRLIETDIRAAVRRYRDFLANGYIPSARAELSVATNPDGAECYRAMLRGYTTLDRAPEDVYALGEKTVNANLEQVQALGQRLFGLSDIEAIVARVKSDPKLHFASAEELVAHSRRTVKAAHEKSQAFFVTLPQAPVVVEPFPEYERGSGRSSHYNPPGEAGVPGEYRISLDYWREETIGGEEVTVAHETWPGHHLQIARALELEDQHRIMKLAFNSGFVEGWGRYAEQLGEEMGLYTTETANISRRLWPARGMVADPGIHMFGWTAEQAANFMAEAGRFSEDESRALVTRIAAIPGQLTAYDSGALAIFALRREAEAALGERFDVREFHERVLENGTLPLWQLQDHVRHWIAEQSAR